MDHTLAQYNRAAFESLAFEKTLSKFIEAGYPEELSQLKFDPRFVIRGLLVDRERGNLLKVDCHKYVKSAFHGRERLDKQTRHKLYNSESFNAYDFVSVDTFFALSEVQLFVEIIDYMRCYPRKIKKSFFEVYEDLRSFMDLSHADGSIKKNVVAHIDRYLMKDPYKSEALLRMKEGGKNLFLLTNSQWEYTDAVMNFLYSDTKCGFSDWKSYFDIIIVGAGKPGFFTGSQPFYQVVRRSGHLKPHSGKFDSGEIYHGGNCHLFQKLTNQKGDEILYCGDHIFGDIIRSKEGYNWRTLLVVEELVDELKKGEGLAKPWAGISNLLQKREDIDNDIQKTRLQIDNLRRQMNSQRLDQEEVSKSLETSLADLESRIKSNESHLANIDMEFKNQIRTREEKIHPVWGDLMRVGLEKSRFAKQVEEYACLYTIDVGNLRFYSPFKRFTSPHDVLPHEG